VIAVGADDTRGSIGTGNDIVPSFSSIGDKSRRVDVIAPGKSVISLRAAGSWIDEHNPSARIGESYFRGSGTSQAAAVTSGAAALLLQARPGLTPDQVKCLLVRSAKPLSGVDQITQGAGVINVDDARKMALPTDCAQSFPRATGTGSLDAARGSMDIYEDGIVLDGEQDIFGLPFDTAEWAGRSWTGTSWQGGDWMGRSWTGDAWCNDGWTGRSWTGRSWTGRSWTGRSWTGRSWTGRSWTGRSWTGEAWSGRSWTSDTWTGHIWSGAGWE
jgi:subtilisin family serine protease